MSSPDATSQGLVSEAVNPLRYGDAGEQDPDEVPGLMRKLMPSNAKVLDIGSGTGGTTKVINSGKENSVLCIEPDPARSAAARQRGLEVVTAVFDENLARELGKFDVVVMGDVLEHIANPFEILSNVRLVLSPGGKLLMSVPNVAHWTVRTRLMFGRFDYQESGIMDSTHLRWFTIKTLIALLESAGFTVLSVNQSAGTWMTEYKSLPWRLLPTRIRVKAIKTLTRAVPKLMGCQHVVCAQT